MVLLSQVYPSFVSELEFKIIRLDEKTFLFLCSISVSSVLKFQQDSGYYYAPFMPRVKRQLSRFHFRSTTSLLLHLLSHSIHNSLSTNCTVKVFVAASIIFLLNCFYNLLHKPYLESFYLNSFPISGFIGSIRLQLLTLIFNLIKQVPGKH